ncbi:MFS transporter [Microbacterium betulae]|uniref:MFS transporter n=1 Tax=Microbacterium betulae TaxID=2981139 RepID=A0AA97FHM9_9MICO|nr:MFS transporter [Microbacterium sp. AB]WOF21697.1 MFS transporter [Microbacterium sp. AB]
MTTMPEPGDAAFDALRRYAPMVYGPTALYSLGQGAILPLLPALAADLGASIASAALIAAAIVVGQLCGNIPAGWLVSRVGERSTMLIAAVASLAGIAGVLLARQIGVLGISVFVLGFCASSFAVARHTFMTTRVPFRYRARALSLVGGSFRLGGFTGPFVTAGLLALFGDEHASVWFFGACLLGVALLVAFGPDPEEKAIAAERLAARDPSPSEAAEDTGEPVTGSVPAGERLGVAGTIWRYRGLLARLGSAAASLSAVRSARQAVLPLWGVSIGLDSQTLALVIGVAGAVEFSLFYVSGQVMDRFGRLWAAVPALLLMGAGFGALAFTHDLDTSVLWFGVLALVIGVGNGLSSGTLMTLGADVAPKADPASFLGAWRTLTDGGAALTPLMISGVTAISSLSVATGLVGVIGLVGAGAFVRYVPRFAPRQR